MDALSSCGDCLLEYGGHELAAGLSIERSKIDEFRKRINEYASPILGESDHVSPLEIECAVSFRDLGEKGIDEILRLEPFGLSNPQPVLVIRNATVNDIVPLSQGKHVRFRISGTENGKTYSLNAVNFGTPFESFPYCDGDVCDIVFTVDMNEYMGTRAPQLFVKDMRISQSDENEISVCERNFQTLKSGGTYNGAENDIPDLAEFRNVFRFIRRESGHEGTTLSLASARRTLEYEFDIPVSLTKLRIILEVLSERGLISLSYRGRNAVDVSMTPAAGKINIDESPLLRAIRAGATKKEDKNA